MTNISSAEQVAEKLTRYYLAALSIMAILCLLALAIVKSSIGYHKSDSRVLNISGRQRMLSQQLTKLALLKDTPYAKTDSLYFAEALQTWYKNQDQLVRGSLQMEEEFQVKKSIDLAEKLKATEPIYSTLYHHLNTLNCQGKTDSLMTLILKKEAVYLKQMDEIVFQFDKESEKRVKELEIIEYIIASVTLLTLILEVFLVFRPIVQYIQKIIQELSESKKEVSLSNEKLREANRHLSLTQKEVLTLQEAHYNKLRMDDQIRSASLMEGQEEERKRLARELHDGVGQMLTGLNLLVARLKKTDPDDPRLKERIEEISFHTQEIIKTTRQISHNVMPDSLVDYGLPAALKALTDQVNKTAQSEVTTEVSGQERRLSPHQEIGLYRIAQEALTNALKYAEADHIKIRLNFDPDKLVLKIEDNGVGFSTERELDWQNAGIDNMQTRAKLLKTEFSLTSEPGKGTAVIVRLNVDESIKDGKVEIS